MQNDFRRHIVRDIGGSFPFIGGKGIGMEELVIWMFLYGIIMTIIRFLRLLAFLLGDNFFSWRVAIRAMIDTTGVAAHGLMSFLSTFL
jgi:hypothetical protein